MNKKKKIFKFSSFGLIGVLSLSLTLPFVLNSCASNSTTVTNPSLHANSFTSMNKDDLSPIALASLSSTEGRQSLLKTFSNKLLENWFGTISNSTLTSVYNKWVSDAEDSYKNEYDNYKNSKGDNWKVLFQKEVLDPVGGTKEDYILNKIYSNVKDKFIEIIFKNKYLSVKDGTNGYVKVDANTKGLISKPENINGAGGVAGTKNNFAFSEAAIEKNSRTSLDYGIADFLNFLMDDWIYNVFPLPISMSLWKNAANPNTSNLFDLTYFGSDTVGTEGSYNFQYFTPKSKSPVYLTTTDKFELLMTNLKSGRYVDKTTGLINLPTDYTEDSSTTMTIEFDKLYSGEISIPFASAALYKLNNEVFGISDQNIYTASDANVVTDSIMKNFLVFNGQTSGSDTTTGVFNFPYDVYINNASVFFGEYQNAKGIRDNINLSGKLGNFILNRNSFGVHLISIDRISKIKEAVGTASGTISLDQYKKACNEIRNTFMYRYAEDQVNGTSKYDIMSSLKTYLTDNFDKILFRYVSSYVNNSTSNTNNLFGAAVVNNTAYTANAGSSKSTFLDFNDQTDQSYIDVLTSISNNTPLSNLLKNAILLEKAESILKTWNNLKSKIYDNAANYNNVTKPDEWKKYGIAGVMSYARNATTGNFDSLSNLITYLIKNVSTTPALPYSSFNENAINGKSTPTITSTSDAITQINTPSDLVSFAKKSYESAIASYVNSVSLQINNKKEYISSPTVVFTNDDYINNSIQANSSASNLNTIAQNFYMQNYLTNQAGFTTNTRRRSSTNVFYDFKSNKISYNTSNTTGDTDWIKQNLQNSINSIYILSNFTDLTNLYSDGDWTDKTKIDQIASDIWNNSWNSSQYNFSSSNSNNIACYENPSEVQDYYKFLITLEYLLDYDVQNNKFTWSNLITFLNDATQNNGKALVGWINQSSIKMTPNFGLNKDSTEISAVANVQTKVETDSQFNGAPLLLTKITPYSWFGAPNYYSSTPPQPTLQYSADKNYWYTSPTLKNNNNKTSAGFVGFQFQRSSSLGTNNELPNESFENSTYTNAPTTTASKISYLGSLYNFGTRDNIIEYVKTKLAVVSDLKNFYDNNLLNPGLPIKQETKEKIENIIQSVSTNSNKVVELTNAIVNLLNDNTQVPDNCFTRMEGMPIWNSDGTTLFSVDSEETDYIVKNQYIVTQFNYQDVQNLLTQDGALNTTTGTGFLGLNPTTFFNCIVDLAMNSTTLQDAAYNNMFEKIGSVAVYDYRLINFIEKVYISNYDDWKEILDL